METNFYDQAEKLAREVSGPFLRSRPSGRGVRWDGGRRAGPPPRALFSQGYLGWMGHNSWW